MTRRDFVKLGVNGGVSAIFGRRLFAAALAENPRATTLILGGGAFSLGYALAHPEGAIVLERGIHLGADFALTGEPETVGTAFTPLGRRLSGKLSAVGIVRDGRLELPPLADCLSSFFADEGGRAFLCGEVVAAARTKEGWRVRILGGGVEGLSTFSVARILDTTDVGWRDEGVDMVRNRHFSLSVESGYFRVTVPPNADARTSRLALYAAWDAAKRDERILAECGALRTFYRASRVERTNPSGMTWVPSAQFPDLLTAFDEGVRWSWH